MVRQFLLALVIVGLSGCAAVSPTVAPVVPATTQPTYTAFPTYTPLATHTPQPTYTALPTYTAVPTQTPLPTNTAEPTATYTPQPTPTNTPEPTVTTRPTTVPTAAPKASAVAPTMAPPADATATVAPSTAGGIEVTVIRMGYDYWGMPAGMYKPITTACGPFDDNHRVLRLITALVIKNNSAQTMQVGTWIGQFYKADGSEAFTCHYLYGDGSSRPEIPPGESRNVAYIAFVETNERVAYGYIIDKVIGKSNRIDVPVNLPLP